MDTINIRPPGSNPSPGNTENQPGPGFRTQIEVLLHVAMPGFVVARVQVKPFLIRHSATSLQERNGVGSQGDDDFIW
jgi:hypothetical protein